MRTRITSFKIWLLTYCIATISLNAFGQPPCNYTGISVGGTGLDGGMDLARDSEGNIYLAGYFSGTINLATNITLISHGGTDAFIAKFTAELTPIWALGCGGTQDDRIQEIDLDNNGNILASGDFKGSVQFGNQTLTSHGQSDAFVLKVNTAGIVQWAVDLGGSSIDNGRSIATNDLNESVLCCFFNGTAQFGTYQLTSSGAEDIAIVKLDTFGNVIWVKQGSGFAGCEPRGIDIDNQGNIALCGYFISDLSFNGLSQPILGIGDKDCFIATFNPSGTCIWGKAFGSYDWDVAQTVKYDQTGNIYVSGVYSAPFTFAGNNLQAFGGYDALLVKYSSSGNQLWASNGGGIGDEFMIGLDVSTNNQLITTGYFEGSALFQGQSLTSHGGRDIFVNVYSTSGSLLNSNSWGSTSSDFGWEAIDNNGTWYACGEFNGTMQVGNQNLTPNGSSDMFIITSNPQPQSTNFTHTISNLTVNFTTSAPLPDSVLWDFGDGSFSTEFNPQHTYASPSTYQVTLTGYFPCNTDTAMHSVQLCEPPVATFIYEPSYLLFHYNNANTVADSLRWFFGDGTTSTQNNPEHLFASPGNYTTSLVAYNNCSSDTFNVSFFACDSMASSFTFTTNGNLVSFTSTSYNYYDVFWDFGDGNTSTELNPTHQYTTGGSYIVSHYSMNACDSLVSTDTVVICEPPVSLFSSDYVGDMTFAFNNLSSNYTSCKWYFGDGDSSTLVNPYHTYDSCLAYEVTLVVTNECGTATFIDTINLLTDLFETNKEPFIALSPSRSGNIEVYTQAQTKNNELYLFNTRGELIYQAHFNNSLTIPAKGFKNGIYILKILNTSGQSAYVKKIQLVR